MKRLLSASLLILFAAGFIFLPDGCARPQNKTVKNVILLIPDGTSLASVSTARWFQRYLNPDATRLNIDPYLCGTILTFCSNAPIGDSAPTTSCYMTGYPSRAGYVSTYPVADPANDIIPMDSLKACQPLMTLLEAARIAQHKSTGLVFTCEFPHATPADCSAHSYRRDRYGWIAPQMVHNQIDVVIGGGVSLLNDENRRFLQSEGYGLFLNDINGFRNYSGNKMWALFADEDMAYDIDRNPAQEPSLAEMTRIAIDKLSRNKNGFFLMVEGSKIDWAAHANDTRAIISDVLTFDKACGEAFRFAESNGETLVVVVPDHGNSGISIGSNKCPGYSSLTKDQLFGNVAKFKTSVDALIRVLHDTPPAGLRQTVLELTGIAITDEEYQQLLQTADYHWSALSDEERMKGSGLTKEVARILDKYTCFGFTTTGHTGEEVFLAVYDPRPGRRMTGFHTSVELNHYIRHAMGLEKQFESLTGEYFAKHTDVFRNYTCTVDTLSDNPVLTVKNTETTLEIQPNTNIAKCNGRELKLNSVVVYVDKNNTFYLPQSLEKSLLSKRVNE